MKIFSFHMPLFFLTSGYFIKNYNVKDNLVKSLKNLVVPYVIICLISLFIDLFISFLKGEMNFNYQVITYLKATVGGMSKASKVFTSFNSVWLVWFVCCLFCSRFIYILISKFIMVTAVKLIIIVCISYFGVVLGNKGYYLPWSLDIALFSAIYLFAGDIVSKNNFSLQKKINRWWTMAVPFTIWVMCIFQNNYLELATRVYNNYICSVVMSVSGCLFILGISKEFDRLNMRTTSFIRWCGNNSIFILAVHLIEMRYIKLERFYRNTIISERWILEAAVQMIFILIVSFVAVSFYKLIRNKNKR